MNDNRVHIAVIRFSAMGDVAMTVPVIAALAMRDDVKITVVSRPFFAPLFEDIPNVSFFGADLQNNYKGVLGMLQLSRELKNAGVDMLADFHNVIRSKIIRIFFKTSGNKTARIDKGRAQKKALTRLKNKVFAQLPTSFERYADVIKDLGYSVDIDDYQFPKKPTLDSAIIKITGEKSEQWIGIAPFAQHPGKMYPADLMKEVVDGLASNKNLKIFLFGGKSESGILKKLAGGHENITVVAGMLDFRQELQLIRNLDVMLSMDSGNAHLAAIYGVKTITLWGATHPFTGFAPFRQPIENAITADRTKYPALPTSIYGNKHVPGYEDAMRTIDPQRIISKVLNEIGVRKA